MINKVEVRMSRNRSSERFENFTALSKTLKINRGNRGCPTLTLFISLSSSLRGSTDAQLSYHVNHTRIHLSLWSTGHPVEDVKGLETHFNWLTERAEVHQDLCRCTYLRTHENIWKEMKHDIAFTDSYFGPHYECSTEISIHVYRRSVGREATILQWKSLKTTITPS